MLSMLGVHKRRFELETLDHQDDVNLMIRRADHDASDEEVAEYLHRRGMSDVDFEDGVNLLLQRRDWAAKLERVEAATEESKQSEHEIRKLQDEFLRFQKEIESKISVFMATKYHADQAVIDGQQARENLLQTGRCPDVQTRLANCIAERGRICNEINSLKSSLRMIFHAVQEQNIRLQNYRAPVDPQPGGSFLEEYKTEKDSVQKQYDLTQAKIAWSERRVNELHEIEAQTREEFLNPAAI